MVKEKLKVLKRKLYTSAKLGDEFTFNATFKKLKTMLRKELVIKVDLRS